MKYLKTVEAVFLNQLRAIAHFVVELKLVTSASTAAGRLVILVNCSLSICELEQVAAVKIETADAVVL